MFNKITISMLTSIFIFFSASNALGLTCPCKVFKAGDVVRGYKIIAVQNQDQNNSLIQLVPIKNQFADANQNTLNSMQKILMGVFVNKTSESPAAIYCTADNSQKKGGISCVLKKE